ncbi:MAG: ribosome biogenesis GTP-binding protein YihA/YsxC [Myxococcota bacterium]
MSASSPPGRIKILSAEHVTSAAQPRQYPASGLPEVALLGRSNVGKSSLLNFMTGKAKLARVSNTPGRTRLVNFFRVELQAAMQRRALFLVDLPGYGYAKMSQAERGKVSRMLGDYVESERPLVAALLLMDIRRDPSDDDVGAASALREAGRNALTVVTKADKVAKNQRKPRASAIARELGLEPREVVLTSAHEESGRGELLELLWTLAEPRTGSTTQEAQP